MQLHEYQAKVLLQKKGIEVPPFYLAESMEDVEKIIKEFALSSAVLKVQIHAGGRGLAGGVKVAKTKDEILLYAKDLLGKKIVNAQTGPQGLVATKILISPLLEIEKELYLGIVLDRKSSTNWLVASPIGGMSIEELAIKDPEKILKIALHKYAPFRLYEKEEVIRFLQIDPSLKQDALHLLERLKQAYFDNDATLVEINPLVVTKNGALEVLDAKISIDDNALFRQKEIESFYDPAQSSKQEVKAREFDLAFVALDGNIGCLVNGAGLAMATMDLIYLKGGHPANFLDVGGSATEEKVCAGFCILFSDPKVKAIVVNIFGGIMNCETIAKALLSAVEKSASLCPVVVRLEGTNVVTAKALLQQLGDKVRFADSFEDAAQKVVLEAK